MTLDEFFQKQRKLALGFSGGVDSSYLLVKAIEQKVDIQPYFISTAFQKEAELQEAKAIAAELGAKIQVIEVDILQDEKVAQNPAKRCYHCKQKLFGEIVNRAKLDGYDVIIDGTNASDDISDRPGFKALQELGILSPLRLCNITKDEVRRELQERGFLFWNKPSSSCLATRIRTDTTITQAKLSQVEMLENNLAKLGFNAFRIRLIDDKTAKIEVREADLGKVVELRKKIIALLEPICSNICLDLKQTR